MTLNLFLALFFSQLGIAGNPEAAEYGSRMYHQVLLRCPDRIWPGIDWRDFQILYSDSTDKNAWLVSRSSLAPEVVRKDQTVEDIFDADFKFGLLDFRGRRTLAVNTEGQTPERLFRLAVHQLFKEAAQSQWENADFDERGTLYPLLPEPRYLRRMAFENLKKAYSSILEKRSPKAHLSAAAYWMQRWRKAYPEEQSMRTDSVEGTALYTEQMAFLFMEAGCGVRESGFNSAFRQHIEPEMALFNDDLLPAEGMSLGSLSSFLLTATQPKWFAKMDGRLMPSDLVLEGIRPVAQKDDLALRGGYEEMVQGQQRLAFRRLNPTLEKEKDKFYARVSIPARWQKGSLGVEQSYVLRERLGTALLILGETQDFRGERGSIHIPSQGTIFQAERNGCGGVYYFLMPLYGLTQSGSRISGRHWWHRFDVEGHRKTVNGYTWICPRE